MRILPLSISIAPWDNAKILDNRAITKRHIVKKSNYFSLRELRQNLYDGIKLINNDRMIVLY